MSNKQPEAAPPSPATDEVQAIRDSVASQAKVKTRFEPGRFRRKEFDSAGKELPQKKRDR